MECPPLFQFVMADIQNKPDNLLVWSVLSTVLCFWPVGAIAIYYSLRVDSLWDRGDVAGAQDAAKKAKTFSIIALCVGAAATVIAIVIILLYLGVLGVALLNLD